VGGRLKIINYIPALMGNADNVNSLRLKQVKNEVLTLRIAIIASMNILSLFAKVWIVSKP